MKIAEGTMPSHNIVVSGKHDNKRAQVGVGWGRISQSGKPYLRIQLNPGTVLDWRMSEHFNITIFERNEQYGQSQDNRGQPPPPRQPYDGDGRGEDDDIPF